jgi:hypothetical protein
MAQGQESRSTFERHAQSLVQAMILAGVLWVGSSVSDLRTDVAVLKTKVEGVDGLRIAVTNLDNRLDGHDTSLTTLDERVKRIEGERQ